ncbi:helix-turn-helix domain-containing protein [Runella sp. SP2]|uniref:helix-turn-helix domain-containing protein n=1 Tax=Runella sp. SP2 TaxID=2268026 RepID=UPI000F0789B3|nr:helix-turn-helix domain-containing protein [Runella sp. SP2]AYQ32513.1 XRE family transcriptional regulator [Runella sp. SP2]
MNLSYNIKSIREAKRVKQLEIAAALEIDPSNYAKLERRGSKLSVEQLEKIARVLDVSVTELITGEPQVVKNDERVKELEVLVNHWKELAEVRSELLKQKEKQLQDIKKCLQIDLELIIFYWIQDNKEKYSIDTNTQWLVDLEQTLPTMQPQNLRKLYIEALWHNNILNYAIAQGLLGKVGEIFREYQLEIMRQLHTKRIGYEGLQDSSEIIFDKPKE